MGRHQGFRSAEDWLRERGVVPESVTSAADDTVAASSDVPGSDAPGSDDPGTDAGARQVSAPSALPTSTLEDDVVVAMGFLRRSANAAPQSEGRLRDKLVARGCSHQVIDLALVRARRERLVDDDALAAALVAERRARGHAPARIRRDLRERGFADDVLQTALGPAQAEDLDAAAFAVAIDKASRNTAVPADTAFRRVAAHVQRRGYPDGLARKVAREAVFSTREDERNAER